MAVNVKMGVDIGGFKQGIQEGQNILKGLNAEMKAADAEFKATGNAEQQLASKTKTLNSQLQVQKGIADQAQKALKAMEESGVKPTDAAYQKMYATMMNAVAGMNEAQAALNGLTGEEQKTAKGAEELTGKLDGIGKKISLQQVTSAINSITTGLENAARKAVEFGEELWNTIMDSARRADDTATMAEMYWIDLDTFQRMQKLVAGGMDTSVESMLSSQDKLKKGIGKGSKDVLSYLQELHVGLREGVLEDWTSWKQKDPVKLFWEAGQALMAMGDAYDKEAAAQALFGKGWKELVPLFNTYHSLEEYNAALAEQTVNDEQTIRDLAALNDAVSKLESSWTTLKDELIGAIAPALTKGADAISGLLDSLTTYLQTEDGQKLLKTLGETVASFFDDLTKMDPDTVVENFESVFTSLTDGLKWIQEHSDEVVAGLKTILGVFVGLEIAKGVTTILNLVNGLNTLLGGGAAAGAASAGASAGASFATGFVNAFVSTAPILAAMLGITAIAVTPAVATQKQYEEKWKKKQEERLAAAEEASAQNADFIRDAAGAVGPKKNADGSYKTGAFGFLDMNPTSEAAELLIALSDRNGIQRAQLFNAIRAYGQYTNGYYTTDLLTQFWANPNSEQFDEATINAMVQNITDALIEAEKPKVPVELKTPEDSAQQIVEQVGEVVIPAVVQVTAVTAGGKMGMGVNGWPTGGGGGGPLMYIKGYANGLPYVPYDGLYRLHRGERVMTAGTNRNYTANSNLYVENMNMNNGMDAQALAAAMSAQNRRISAGFGS